jgi:glycosyltransferase involved in cell wall biosynthesis
MAIDLIVVFPAHNEAKRLPQVLVQYCSCFEQKKIKYNIIVVDNASTDDTFALVSNCHWPAVEVIKENRLGKGRAIKSGWEKALAQNSNYLAFVDADGSTTAEEFFRLYQLSQKYDGLIASRLIPGARIFGRSFGRQIVSLMFRLIRNLIIKLPFIDTQCGAKIFKTSAIKKVIDKLTIYDMAFDVQLLALLLKEKFIIKEEPTTWIHTADSATFNSPLSLFKTAKKMFFSLWQIRRLLKIKD